MNQINPEPKIVLSHKYWKFNPNPITYRKIRGVKCCTVFRKCFVAFTQTCAAINKCQERPLGTKKMLTNLNESSSTKNGTFYLDFTDTVGCFHFACAASRQFVKTVIFFQNTVIPLCLTFCRQFTSCLKPSSGRTKILHYRGVVILRYLIHTECVTDLD